MKVRVYKNTNTGKGYRTKKGVLYLSDNKLRLQDLDIQQNKLYNASTCSLTGEKVIFRNVIANVPQTVEGSGLNIEEKITVTEPGEYHAKDYNIDGWEAIEVALPKLDPFEENPSIYNIALNVVGIGENKVTLYSRRVFSLPEYTCYKLSDISFDYEMDDSCLEINSNSFVDCNYLENFRMSSNIKYIGENCFVNCESLNYNIYKNGKYLGNEVNPYIALIGVVDTSEAIVLNDNVQCIAVDCFNSYNVNFAVKEGEYYYIPSDSNLHYCMIGAVQTDNEIVIPNDAKMILNLEFETTNINELIIPNSVETIIDSINLLNNITLNIGANVCYIKNSFITTNIDQIKLNQNNHHLKLQNGVLWQEGDTVCLTENRKEIILPSNTGRIQTGAIYITNNSEINTVFIVELPKDLELIEDVSLYSTENNTVLLILDSTSDLHVETSSRHNALYQYFALLKGSVANCYKMVESGNLEKIGYCPVHFFELQKEADYDKLEEFGYQKEILTLEIDGKEKSFETYGKLYSADVFYWKRAADNSIKVALRNADTKQIEYVSMQIFTGAV